MRFEINQRIAEDHGAFVSGMMQSHFAFGSAFDRYPGESPDAPFAL